MSILFLLVQEVKDFLRHAARVTCLAWSPDSKQLVSGSVDTNLAIYKMDSQDSEYIKGISSPL